MMNLKDIAALILGTNNEQPSTGVIRAAARLAAHRAAQAERLKDAVEPPLSRQVSRRNMRKQMKRHIQAVKMDRQTLPMAERMAVSA